MAPKPGPPASDFWRRRRARIPNTPLPTQVWPPLTLRWLSTWKATSANWWPRPGLPVGALQLDPASVEALASLAVLSYSFDHDWTSAELDFKRALELNPSFAHGHLEYATALVTRARFDAAIAHIRTARALDPLSFAIGNDLSFALECAGRYDESIASARQTLHNDPTFVYAHIPLGVDLSDSAQ